ncbi:pantetheine-phosphate adenylyltransferase [Sulfuriroseicoccus oceanibius]|uniref:Phosphopantetheine adenylyltransferase n=1 Tax=Sulfuriroseicoccus oceanibius TaxID=2707525 RepID=A0A6B3L7E6_9BACT|nr:pantetheine-phosphate adenylyltransferase [Sulfuriroseicoccus oceanibius]QQL46312.1 pantetheine-phosphate adenylyltransferase [Sulfuriroseicoccus oceanibius]
MRTALYPGSFDPITYGHLDIVQRASKLFDEVIVAAAHNDAKNPLFTNEERVDLITETLAKAGITNARAVTFDGLLVNYAEQLGVTAVIRGLRAISDFEFEFQMALMNRKLKPELETIFLMPKDEYSYLSSRMVKEVARLDGDISSFVPPHIATALRSKLKA